jgi:hypothetical protein
VSIGVEKAVLKVQDFFRKQCGGAAQTYWELLEATEDPVKGVYERSATLTPLSVSILCGLIWRLGKLRIQGGCSMGRGRVHWNPP